MENEFLVLSGEGSTVPITGGKGPSTSIGVTAQLAPKSEMLNFFKLQV